MQRPPSAYCPLNKLFKSFQEPVGHPSSSPTSLGGLMCCGASIEKYLRTSPHGSQRWRHTCWWVSLHLVSALLVVLFSPDAQLQRPLLLPASG